MTELDELDVIPTDESEVLELELELELVEDGSDAPKLERVDAEFGWLELACCDVTSMDDWLLLDNVEVVGLFDFPPPPPQAVTKNMVEKIITSLVIRITPCCWMILIRKSKLNFSQVLVCVKLKFIFYLFLPAAFLQFHPQSSF